MRKAALELLSIAAVSITSALWFLAIVVADALETVPPV